MFSDHIAPRVVRRLAGLVLLGLAVRALGQSGVPLGEVASGQLREVSGLAASRRYPGLLWVHNDGGDGRLFAIRTNGQTTAVFKLAAAVTDLEDIAIGPSGADRATSLYLGDIGDNDERRRLIRVYRFPEPDLPSDTTPKRPALLSRFETIALRYPDGPHDAEALLCDPRTGDLIVATKQKRKSRLYLAPAERLTDGATVALKFLREMPLAGISAGDISPDGRYLVLRREDAAFGWSRGAEESLAVALATPSWRAMVVGPPDEPNGEAIAWGADGQGYYTLSEGKRQPIWYFAVRRSPPAR